MAEKIEGGRKLILRVPTRSPRSKESESVIVFFRGPPEWPESAPTVSNSGEKLHPPFTGKTTLETSIKGGFLGFRGRGVRSGVGLGEGGREIEELAMQ